MSTNPEIVVQADIGGGLNVAFTIPTGSFRSDDLDQSLDIATKAIARQKAKLDLAQQLLALQVNEKMLSSLPAELAEEVKSRAEERMRMRAQYESEHYASQKHGQFKMTKAQEASIQQFDKQTEQRRERADGKKRELQGDRPIIEAQISRLRAIIAGRDPAGYVQEDKAA